MKSIILHLILMSLFLWFYLNYKAKCIWQIKCFLFRISKQTGAAAQQIVPWSADGRGRSHILGNHYQQSNIKCLLNNFSCRLQEAIFVESSPIFPITKMP
jgi:uncharacterized membrane protein